MRWANSLVYWVQACLKAGLMDRGARIFAMTSIGGSRAAPNCGPVSAAKATLEAHIRQLAVGAGGDYRQCNSSSRYQHLDNAFALIEGLW